MWLTEKRLHRFWIDDGHCIYIKMFKILYTFKLNIDTRLWWWWNSGMVCASHVHLTHCESRKLPAATVPWKMVWHRRPARNKYPYYHYRFEMPYLLWFYRVGCGAAFVYWTPFGAWAFFFFFCKFHFLFDVWNRKKKRWHSKRKWCLHLDSPDLFKECASVPGYLSASYWYFHIDCIPTNWLRFYLGQTCLNLAALLSIWLYNIVVNLGVNKQLHFCLSEAFRIFGPILCIFEGINHFSG